MLALEHQNGRGRRKAGMGKWKGCVVALGAGGPCGSLGAGTVANFLWLARLDAPVLVGSNPEKVDMLYPAQWHVFQMLRYVWQP